MRFVVFLPPFPSPSFVFAGRLHHPRRSIPSQPPAHMDVIVSLMHSVLELHAETLILKLNIRINAVKYDTEGI